MSDHVLVGKEIKCEALLSILLCVFLRQVKLINSIIHVH